jgi:hypothetical protein
VARRIEERAAALERARHVELATSDEPRAPRMPRPLDRLPWDLAQDEFGTQGSEFIGAFGRLLVRSAQDERRTQMLDSVRELSAHPQTLRKTSSGP